MGGVSSGDLLVRHTASQVAEAVARESAKIEAAFKMIDEAERALCSVISQGELCGDRFRVDVPHQTIQFDKFALVEMRLRRTAWRSIVNRLELRKIMSMAAWADLDRRLDGDELPELTTENIVGVVQGYGAQAPNMLEDAVKEVFDQLRPRGDRFKTNSQLAVGKRVILGWVIESGFPESIMVRYESEQFLTALENVFNALEGRGCVNKTTRSALSLAIGTSGGGHGETSMFRFRACKNGNLHIEFKNVDTVEKLNAVAGGKRLAR